MTTTTCNDSLVHVLQLLPMVMCAAATRRSVPHVYIPGLMLLPQRMFSGQPKCT